MYLRTRRVASQCGFLGSCINWLSTRTKYTMSGLVTDKYINLPINRLYLLESFNFSPSVKESFRLCSIGNLSGCAPVVRPVSWKMSRAYFLWEIKISFLDLENSMPIIYYKFPKSKNIWLKLTLGYFSLKILNKKNKK